MCIDLKKKSKLWIGLHSESVVNYSSDFCAMDLNITNHVACSGVLLLSN